ncbi:unnamed protein product [Camellia sinensis]
MLMKQIQATHAPDGHEINVRFIFQIVEDILTRSGMHAPSSVSILFKCIEGKDDHQVAALMFNMLSSYSWDAKLVLTLSAFALYNGHLWLLIQTHTSNVLTKSMAMLKGLPRIMEHIDALKLWFDELSKLITTMLDLSRCIVALTELPSSYVTQDMPALSEAMATVPIAVYSTVRGMLTCANQIYFAYRYAASAGDLPTITYKINSIHDHLKKKLDLCYKLIEEKKNVEAYEALLHIFEMVHIDNMKVLRTLIYPKDDLQPLFDGPVSRLGTAWQEPMIWFFWTRLESMLFSKIQLGRANDYNPMMEEIKKLLSYDKSGGGWAMFCKGSEVVVNGHGSTVLPTLLEYTDMWKQNVITKGFDKLFKDHHDRLHGFEHLCCLFEFPSMVERILESMKCPECLRSMEKHITFICCHDENPVTNILD